MPAYRDEKSGTWFCKCYYTDWMGLRRQKWKRGFPTKREAKEFERNFLQRQSDSPEILFENLYRVYLEEMEVRLKPSTVLIKKNICESKILPYFGKKSVNEISAVEVRKWQNFLMKSEQKYSETYLKTIHNQLSAIMNYANCIFRHCFTSIFCCLFDSGNITLRLFCHVLFKFLKTCIIHCRYFCPIIAN